MSFPTVPVSKNANSRHVAPPKQQPAATPIEQLVALETLRRQTLTSEDLKLRALMTLSHEYTTGAIPPPGEESEPCPLIRCLIQEKGEREIATLKFQKQLSQLKWQYRENPPCQKISPTTTSPIVSTAAQQSPLSARAQDPYSVQVSPCSSSSRSSYASTPLVSDNNSVEPLSSWIAAGSTSLESWQKALNRPTFHELCKKAIAAQVALTSSSPQEYRTKIQTLEISRDVQESLLSYSAQSIPLLSKAWKESLIMTQKPLSLAIEVSMSTEVTTRLNRIFL